MKVKSMFATLKKIGSRVVSAVRKSVKAVVAVGAIALGCNAMATDTPPDASTIVSTATTTFNTVGALVASIVGFFVIVKIVKWIRR